MTRWEKWRTTIWLARASGTYPNAHVCLGPNDSVEIYAEDGKGQAIGIRIPHRSLARLLAKRITQCLDDTSKTQL